MAKAKRASGTLLVATALVSMGLFVPSAAAARGPYYPDWQCEQRMRTFCAQNWEAEGWATYQECVDWEISTVCYFPGYPGYPGLADRAAPRPW